MAVIRQKQNAIPELTPSEMQEISAVQEKEELFRKIEDRFGFNLSSQNRRAIANALHFYASCVFKTQRDRPDSQKSNQKLARALNGVLLEINRQRTFEVHDPRRDGYEMFVMESHLRDDSYPPDRADEMETFHDPYGRSYASLGNRQGWLEQLLIGIHETLSSEPVDAKKRGPKGKSAYRWYLLSELAGVFERNGGEVKAFKNGMTSKVEGAFLEFAQIIIEACPKRVTDYAGVGLGDAIVEWIQKGRPASPNVINLFDGLVEGLRGGSS